MNKFSGIGLRSPYFEEILNMKPQLGFFEVISENFMTGHGKHRFVLETLRADYPFSFHGLSLNIGSTAEISEDYLLELKRFISDFDPFVVSDHFCWAGAHARTWYDLFPVPRTEESLNHIVKRIVRVQEKLGRQLAFENISSYLEFKTNEISEPEFLVEICEQADCHLLLDINNVYVNSVNHDFDARNFLNQIPVERVKQIHLAGHEDRGSFLYDTHDQEVCDEVWQLYEYFIERAGAIPTLIERDEKFPPLAEILKEANCASEIIEKRLQHNVA